MTLAHVEASQRTAHTHPSVVIAEGAVRNDEVGHAGVVVDVHAVIGRAINNKAVECDVTDGRIGVDLVGGRIDPQILNREPFGGRVTTRGDVEDVARRRGDDGVHQRIGAVALALQDDAFVHRDVLCEGSRAGL